MADARISMDLRQRGADLRTIAGELRRMDRGKVTELFRARLGEAARPVVPRVKAAALAIPVKDPARAPELRARIAECVEASTWTEGEQAGVSVFVNPKKMPYREMSLPLYMQGAKPRWRHPVYGPTLRNPEPGWAQEAPRPFFYGEARKLGPAAAAALRRALDDITRKING